MNTKAPVVLVTALIAAPNPTFAQRYSVEVIGPIMSAYTLSTVLNNNGHRAGLNSTPSALS